MPKPNTPGMQTQVTPDPALEKRSRRSFTADYKLRILSEADQCAHGEVGALLRRERLYSNQLSQWRRERAAGGVARLDKSAPGPKARLSPEQKELARLRKENTRLQRKLGIAQGCLDLQKKSLGAARSHGQWLQHMNTVIHPRPADVPLTAACHALALNRSSVYHRLRPRADSQTATPPRQPEPQPRALSDQERQQVLDVLHSARFCDQPPAQVYQQLLEENTYLCSISTMHRLLCQAGQQGERRNQRPAQHHAVPRLSACAPNAVWTWDITKLATLRRSSYLSLYVVLDLYSRLVVAWMISAKENSALAQQLLDQATHRYAIVPGQLTLHQDRGAPMIAHSFLDLMSELGVTASHSRPRVSNDNPFSEAQFKTQKNQPDYPQRFTNIEHARTGCGDYFAWYNTGHQHSGLAGFTPQQVFTGEYVQIAADKQAALDAMYASKPERFVRGRPVVNMPPKKVFINPFTPEQIALGHDTQVNFPTLTAAKRKSTLSLN